MTTSVVSGAASQSVVAAAVAVVMETYIWVCSLALLLTYETIIYIYEHIYTKKTKHSNNNNFVIVKRNVRSDSKLKCVHVCLRACT